MKRILSLLAAAFVCGGLFAQFRYQNPVLHADYSDPDVCRVGEDYWMTASSFNCFPGLPILHSRDLVNWELVGAALTEYPGAGWDGPENDFRTVVHHGKAVWAPAIRFHEGWYYIYVGDPDRGIFMVRTQDPAGPWEPPVWVVREKGFIDPCPFWDEDGKAYLSHGCAGSRAGNKSILFVAPMAPDGTRLLGPSRIVYDGHLSQPTIEGTKFYKRDGKYYIFSPAGGVATGWQTVLRADNPFGPYEERIVMAWAPGTINGPHQGAWVDTPEGEDWFLHFQDKGAYGRILHLQPMTWRADGWPLIGEDPDGDGVGQPVGDYRKPTVIPSEAKESRTAYKPYGIGLEWQYPALPSPYWHYALQDGVRLYSVQQTWPYRSLWDCPNFLAQKFPAERFTVRAKLSFRPNPQLKAVLPYRYEPLPHSRESKNVPLVNYPDVPEVVVWAELDVRAKAVDGNVPDAVCRFSYSLDGKRFTGVEGSFKAQPELWVGAKYGFWCNRFAAKNDSGWMDVTDLVVKPAFDPLEGFLYDEEKVPAYELPDLLAGTRTVKDWEKKRRPELVKLFEEEMFGSVPGKPAGLHFRVRDNDPAALDGMATRRQVRIFFDQEESAYEDLLLYIPNRRKGPAPAFMGVNFFGNHTIGTDPGIFLPDSVRYTGLRCGDFLLRGCRARCGRLSRYPLTL